MLPAPPAPPAPPGAAAASTPAPPPAAAARWTWQSGADRWTDYPPPQAAALERAWTLAEPFVRIDSQRQVDLQRMRQQRLDEPSRSRPVRREAPAPPGREADGASPRPKRQRGGEEASARAWRLTRLHFAWAGVVPSEANEGTVGLGELLSADELRGAAEVHLHNFMVDLDWVVEEAPALLSFGGALRVFHGDGRPPHSAAVRGRRGSTECFAPPHEQWGTYHSKAILIIRPACLTVHVATANFIFSDWHNKTNAVWSAAFPRLDSPPARPAPESFGEDLLEYYEAMRRLGAAPPAAWLRSSDGAQASISPPRSERRRRVGVPPALMAAPPLAAPQDCRRQWAALDLEWVARYDYSAARARLVTSVPGHSPGVAAGRHAGAQLGRFGHMKVRRLLEREGLSDAFADSSLVLQFSSLSSVGAGGAWLLELVKSLSGGSSHVPPIRAIFPSRQQVRRSLEGWSAGASLPCNSQNAFKLMESLEKLSGTSANGRLCLWDGGPPSASAGATGRAAALPHIKTYARYTEDGMLAWALLTSSNLSQAAWGKLEKSATQLYVKSYEMGVLVLPSMQPAGMRSLASTSAASTSEATLVPLPFSIPPVPYCKEDVVWSNDVVHPTDAPDRYGWRSHDLPAPSFYGRGATGRILAEQEARRRVQRPNM
ncbi:hypothetical protein AB1Y20_005544 [Prymnesium parvum]|uniref:WWE domain-containing protein n=1 Tax=Prymnesium parvum TaxID=97485 RepID=A0AB34J4M2_PRYPA